MHYVASAHFSLAFCITCLDILYIFIKPFSHNVDYNFPSRTKKLSYIKFLVHKVGFAYGAKLSCVKDGALHNAGRQDNNVYEQIFDCRQSQTSDQAVCL